MREIDITKQHIHCCDDFDIDIEGQTINIPYELWFDIRKYFDFPIPEDAYINFYTFWHLNGDITATVEISFDDKPTETHEWVLTEIEKAFLRGMMESYCYCRYGLTLAQMWENEKED